MNIICITQYLYLALTLNFLLSQSVCMKSKTSKTRNTFMQIHANFFSWKYDIISPLCHSYMQSALFPWCNSCNTVSLPWRKLHDTSLLMWQHIILPLKLFFTKFTRVSLQVMFDHVLPQEVLIIHADPADCTAHWTLLLPMLHLHMTFISRKTLEHFPALFTAI